MNTCEYCSNWDKHQDVEHDNPDNPKWGHCSRMGSRDGKPTGKNTFAYGSDYEQFEAGVITKFDFGCVMYEGLHTIGIDQ